MKIALVSQEYPPETAKGGIGSQTYMKANGLARLGHQVFVISRSLSHRHEVSEGNLTVIRIPGLEDSMYDMTEIVEWITHSTVVAAEIDALHKRVGLDIIDFPEWGAEGYVYLLNRTEWNNVPVVIQLHGPLVMFAQTMGWPPKDSEFYRIGTHMESTCIRLADAVYSSSACSGRWIQEYYSPKHASVPTIHLGVDTDVFKPVAAAKNERPTIVFVGKIVPNKGVEELVDAAVNLAPLFPGLQVCFYGRGQEKYVQCLKEKGNQSGTSQLLQFKGFIDKKLLPGILSQAHLFVAPSYYEGGPGFVYLEAMACGLPVIGCCGSGIDEVVTSGFNGLLVAPKDSVALQKALRMLLSDETLRATMGNKALEYVKREANTKLCLKKLEAFYLDVLAGRHPHFSERIPYEHHDQIPHIERI